MQNVKVWVILFLAIFLGGWAILAFLFWQIIPDSYAFFRIWGLTAAWFASIGTWLAHIGREGRKADK